MVIEPPQNNQSINQSAAKPSKNDQSQQLHQFKVLEVVLWQAQHSLCV
jgi:hypothetical protein